MTCLCRTGKSNVLSINYHVSLPVIRVLLVACDAVQTSLKDSTFKALWTPRCRSMFRYKGLGKLLQTKIDNQPAIRLRPTIRRRKSTLSCTLLKCSGAALNFSHFWKSWDHITPIASTTLVLVLGSLRFSAAACVANIGRSISPLTLQMYYTSCSG
jgi:hypothetical protein